VIDRAEEPAPAVLSSIEARRRVASAPHSWFGCWVTIVPPWARSPWT
jgi:hypothetical protein